jgi:chromosomal replication initiator protein
MAEFAPSGWLKAQDIIKKEVANEQTYATWFGPIKFLSSADNIITLEVPNKFFRDWLLDRYIALITASISKAAGKEYKVEFFVREGSAVSPMKAAVKEVIEKKEAKGFWPFAKEKPDAAKEIGLEAKFTFDSFVVGPSNRFVHAASLAVCDSPAKAYNPLFIYGGTGLGKTHLMQAIAQRVLEKHSRFKILYISSENFTNHLINAIQTKTTQKFRDKYRSVDLLLIDDIQFIAGKESTQEEFFHTFNDLYEAHKQIVVSSDKPPKEIGGLEERLVSRFLYGLVTDIQPPDFETRMAILKKKSEAETIVIPDDVFYFLAEKVRTNIRELEGALKRVFFSARLMGKDVTIDMAKEVLKDMIIEGEKRVTIDLIQKHVCDYFGIKLSDMKVKKRSRAIAYPRQIAMYLARQLTDYSLPEIGEHFGGRDHTTVLHAHEKIENDLKVKKGLTESIDKLIRDIKG